MSRNYEHTVNLTVCYIKMLLDCSTHLAKLLITSVLTRLWKINDYWLIELCDVSWLLLLEIPIFSIFQVGTKWWIFNPPLPEFNTTMLNDEEEKERTFTFIWIAKKRTFIITLQSKIWLFCIVLVPHSRDKGKRI